jgi:diguanylate cyclase (GGDEF)-like protein
MSPYIKNSLLPLISLTLVLLVSVRYGNVWSRYQDQLLVLPYILYGAGAIAALFLLQYAYLYTALLFCSVFGIVQLHLQAPLSDPQTYAVFLFVNVFFPIVLMGSVLLGRKPPSSRGGVFLLIVTFSFICIPYVFWYVDTPAWLAQLPWVLFAPMNENTVFGVGLLISYLPVVTFMALLYFLNPTALQAYWLIGLLSVLGVFISFRLPNISGVVFTVLAGLLLIALLQEAFLMAYVDELTDIPGRKALEKQMAALGRRYSIAMLDIDHFKKFNDTHGHDVGDQVLRMVAARINKVTGGGKAYRYGGEEFTILFPGKTVEQTLTHLEMVRESVANYAMSLREQNRTKDDKLGKKRRKGSQGKCVKVTISIGVAQRSEVQDEPSSVIKQADKALYAAKNSGRNCIKAFKQGRR